MAGVAFLLLPPDLSRAVVGRQFLGRGALVWRRAVRLVFRSHMVPLSFITIALSPRCLAIMSRMA
eukprot:4804126-Prorocentrum_lima.AAC.1